MDMRSVVQPSARTTLADGIYGQLRDLISAGKFRPGEKLVIDSLAKQFEVSITPVREALRRLEREGLVTEEPYKGMVVSNASHRELGELFAVRGVLEGYAIAEVCRVLTVEDLAVTEGELQTMELAVRSGDLRAFRRHNTRFHDSILRHAPSETLQRMIADLARNTNRYRLLDADLDAEYMRAAQAEHHKLVELLQQRRAKDAERLARRHALTFVEHLMHQKERD
jgi:DNA-binding GntR family transcriptional regulator